MNIYEAVEKVVDGKQEALTASQVALVKVYVDFVLKNIRSYPMAKRVILESLFSELLNWLD